jgi:hypothetical protein
MGDITRSSDAIATPAIAATDMSMAVSELNIIAETNDALCVGFYIQVV